MTWLSDGNSDGVCRLGQHLMLSGEEPIQRLSEILEQVEPIRHVDRLGCCLACAVGKRPTSIPTDHLHLLAVVLLQPPGEGGGVSVWRHIDDAMLVEIHQDRAVGAAAAEGKVVDTQGA